VVKERNVDTLQAVVDQAPHAATYYSDGFATYRDLVYGDATYTAISNKSQTYTVEGGNADLRHYLARLGRKSRCIHALRCVVKLFIWCYNQRQLWKQRYPRYPKQVSDFVPPLC
jgi:IS1 family transposase